MLETLAGTMAKKKTGKPLSYDDLRPGRPVAAQFRGSPEFKEWMASLASHNRASVSQTIEQALIHYARTIGFTDAPPER